METIRGATLGDRGYLEAAFLAMLQEGVERGARLPMKATPSNAQVFFDVFLAPGIESHDPVLIAELEGEPVGCLLWTAYAGVFELERAKAHGHGIYVAPAHRHLGIAHRLRGVGLAILRQNGIEELEGVIDTTNVESIAAAERAGFRVHSCVFSKVL